MSPGTLPYWQVNVSLSKRSAECPDFLVHANAKDQQILSTIDGEYHRLTWPEVRHIIQTNRIDLFQRVPSDLRRYLEYNWGLKKRYGSVMNFVVQERLHWNDLKPHNSEAFADPDDIKILWNDWPYGIDEKIVHLVVWTKFDLEDDPATDDLTPAARKLIDEYVDRTFGSQMDPEHVIWFKNWRSLKSVHAVEHFHVMLYDPRPDFVDRLTNGDVPLSRKV
ncbi:MAG: hypothetical protein M1817_003391 [Caeruleum heppii]|nr:MAG: hypothetical protein M1817_003391 [Caeruleum heppii]